MVVFRSRLLLDRALASPELIRSRRVFAQNRSPFDASGQGVVGDVHNGVGSNIMLPPYELCETCHLIP